MITDAKLVAAPVGRLAPDGSAVADMTLSGKTPRRAPVQKIGEIAGIGVYKLTGSIKACSKRVSGAEALVKVAWWGS